MSQAWLLLPALQEAFGGMVPGGAWWRKRLVAGQLQGESMMLGYLRGYLEAVMDSQNNFGDVFRLLL